MFVPRAPSLGHKLLGALAAAFSAMTARRRADHDALRRANRPLAEGEELYRAVVEQQLEWIARYTPDLTITFLNQAYGRQLGRDPRELVGTSLADLIADGDAERLAGQLATLTPDAPSATFEISSFGPDGRPQWQKWTDRAIFDERGRVVEYLSVGHDVTQRRQAQDALSASELKLRSFTESASDAMLVADGLGRIVSWNRGAEAMFGYAQDEVLGELIAMLMPARYAEAHQRGLERVTATGDARLAGQMVALQGRRRNGEEFPIELSLAHWDAGDGIQYGAIIRDVSERARAEVALRESEDRFRRMSMAASEAIVIHEGGRTLDVNPAFTAMFGYGAAERLGRPVTDPIAPESHATVRYHVENRIEAPYEAIGLRRDGTRFPVEIEGKTIEVDGRTARVTILRDVSHRKTLEERLVHQALHDALTGLANRALFEDRLGQALARAARDRRQVAVLFVDLDNFKVVNDSLGHQAGDELIVQVADRVSASLRASDTAARFGGDELTVLLEGIVGPEDAVVAAACIIDALRAPFVIGGRDVFATASIGIAVSVPGVSEPVGLLREADLAMYRAKAGGKARYELFDPSMTVDALERLELETDLRRAIEREELRVVYQPIWSLETGRVSELEALLRWDHPTRGPISPARFIPIAEEIGMIDPIGRWVLERACRQAMEWQRDVEGASPFTLSVNLSIRQFQNPRLVEEIAEVVRATGFPASRLKLEVTESAIMEDAATTIGRLEELKALGLRLAIDDFGTGYSSLSHLKRLPVDTLKIDRAFVDGLGRDPQDTAIVRGVIALARSLGLDVTGEGVETPEQVAQLRALGCDRGQGYLLARPLTADATAGLLAGGAPSPHLAPSPNPVPRSRQAVA